MITELLGVKLGVKLNFWGKKETWGGGKRNLPAIMGYEDTLIFGFPPF
jgi:hypothetical protein